MNKDEKWHQQTNYDLKLLKSIVFFIIHQHNKKFGDDLQLTISTYRPAKLDDEVKRVLIYDIEQKFHDDLKSIYIFLNWAVHLFKLFEIK